MWAPRDRRLIRPPREMDMASAIAWGDMTGGDVGALEGGRAGSGRAMKLGREEDKADTAVMASGDAREGMAPKGWELLETRLTREELLLAAEASDTERGADVTPYCWWWWWWMGRGLDTACRAGSERVRDDVWRSSCDASDMAMVKEVLDWDGRALLAFGGLGNGHGAPPGGLRRMMKLHGSGSSSGSNSGIVVVVAVVVAAASRDEAELSRTGADGGLDELEIQIGIEPGGRQLFLLRAGREADQDAGPVAFSSVRAGRGVSVRVRVRV